VGKSLAAQRRGRQPPLFPEKKVAFSSGSMARNALLVFGYGSTVFINITL
jgi:hypothetical protein